MAVASGHEEAWIDAESTAYVPSRYAACFDDGSGPVDTSEYLSQLPKAPRDLLASARRLALSGLVEIDSASTAWAKDSTAFCFDLATEEARMLVMALDEAGVEAIDDGARDEYLVSGSLPEPEDYPEFNATVLSFVPILPHGVPAFTGG